MNKKPIQIKELLISPEYVNKEITVQGWVRTRRGSKSVAFIHLNDGSCFESFQVVADLASFDEETIKKVTTGACLAVTGTVVESQGKGQSVEMQAKTIKIYGEADP